MRRYGLLLIAMLLAACGGRAPATPPVAPLAAPPPVPPPRIVAFRAEPATVKPGASATLRWETQGALAANLEPNFGVVELTGTRQVEPRRTTVYHLTVHGGGHTVTAEATVSVAP